MVQLKPGVAAASRKLQLLAATTVSIAGTALAATGVWVFRTRNGAARESVWTLILTERVTLGFLRLAVLGVALYVLASVAALALSGRWIRALTTTGFEIDDPKDIEERLERVDMKLREVVDERDQLLRLLKEYLGG